MGEETSQDFEYAFISYSREQFFTQGEDEINNWKQHDEVKDKAWPRDAEKALKAQIDIDRGCLTRIALKAIEESRLNAFYIDFECVDPATLEQGGKDKSGKRKVGVVLNKNY